MKKLLFAISLFTIHYSLCGQDLKYYLPDSVSYNPAIPKPKDIIYHEVGEWHVTHDRLVNYMRAVATAAPDRIKLEMMGFTYEGRPQVLLIITSPKNHQRLEEIRQQHLQLSDPTKSASVNIENMPIVVWIGHSIHGNEPSGANAALLSAYYLAAAQGKQIDELLDNVVILFDPSFNPDGLQRFSTWANQHKSKNLVSDPNSREFNEVWPGGRFNHYWFDLNRDWLPAVHIESQNRLAWFHKWKPNILTDHHEQGSNATFFFQPGVPSRVNPLTPDKNQELTAKLAKFHAQFLDRIGSLYFTKENYDDFYYGKGSTYPDINGAIGILFEQASSRGHLQQTANGLLSFPFTIRNQFITALSTLEGAKTLRKEFLQWQRDFYKNVMTEAVASPVKGYVFGSENDKTSTSLFVKMLRRHEIEVSTTHADISIDGNLYRGNQTFVVSLEQKQNKVIRAIFEKTLDYKDSLFYDITSWTMPLAFGLPYAELNAAQLKTVYEPELIVDRLPQPILAQSNYGYLIPWSDLMAPAALNGLLEKGIAVKAATMKFEAMVNGSSKKFNPGTLFVPVQYQSFNSDNLYTEMVTILSKYVIPSYAVQSGASVSGVDLGSSKFVVITKPSVAMIVGPGVNATDAGEVWHLLDQRMNIPSTHLEPSVFNRVELNKYNTLIMVGGTYPDLNKEKLKTWVQAGGTLILSEEAVTWASQNGITDVKFKKVSSPVDSASRLAYTDREQIDGAQQIQGAIFGAEVDLAHPLAYGYNQKTVSLFKANKVFMEKSKNPYATPFYYGSKPLQSGWVSQGNYGAIKNSAAVIVNTVGNGRVINIADNPNFRAFWLGGSKLFMNAIFFGRIIDAAAGRTDD
ncbi:MAG TPA: M14 metallopeptidase family protein [Chitinophagaceae bacterium]|nr:M14 metallopeptidase family protein [Chitinophagaceae bacterium]